MAAPWAWPIFSYCIAFTNRARLCESFPSDPILQREKGCERQRKRYIMCEIVEHFRALEMAAMPTAVKPIWCACKPCRSYHDTILLMRSCVCVSVRACILHAYMPACKPEGSIGEYTNQTPIGHPLSLHSTPPHPHSISPHSTNIALVPNMH